MRARAAVVVALCAVVLAACGGSGSPAPSRSPSPTGVPTAAPSSPTPVSSSASAPQAGPLLTGAGVSPGEKPPVRSDESKPHTANGALEFASYFYEALDWSIATTNSYLLKQISADDCESCSNYISKIDSVEGAGGSSTGARIMVTSVALAHGTLVKADYIVQVKIHQSAQTLLPSVSGSPLPFPPQDDVTYVYLGWGPTGWQVLDVTHE